MKNLTFCQINLFFIYFSCRNFSLPNFAVTGKSPAPSSSTQRLNLNSMVQPPSWRPTQINALSWHWLLNTKQQDTKSSKVNSLVIFHCFIHNSPSLFCWYNDKDDYRGPHNGAPKWVAHIQCYLWFLTSFFSAAHTSLFHPHRFSSSSIFINCIGLKTW